MKTLILSIIISIYSYICFGSEITNQTVCVSHSEIYLQAYKKFFGVSSETTNQTVCVSSKISRRIDRNFFLNVNGLWTKTTNKIGIYRTKEYSNLLNEIFKLQADIVNTDKYDTEKIEQLKIRFENLKSEAETLISTASRREKFTHLQYIKNNKK